ncbi:MAG: hypothetical protein NC115_12580, partial [Bacteroidales bacterium]|nr:hypothetical protein [Bacteroidales bacterium]
ILAIGNKNSSESCGKSHFGGNEVENLMAKVRNLSDIHKEIAFTEFDFYQQYIETYDCIRQVRRL